MKPAVYISKEIIANNSTLLVKVKLNENSKCNIYETKRRIFSSADYTYAGVNEVLKTLLRAHYRIVPILIFFSGLLPYFLPDHFIHFAVTHRNSSTSS